MGDGFEGHALQEAEATASSGVSPMDPATLPDGDWTQCYALHCAAHAERGTRPGAGMAAYRMAQQRPRSETEQPRWLARQGERIVGKADLTLEGPAWDHARLALYVLPGARRHGVGRALMRAVVDWAQQQDCQRIDVGVELPFVQAICERWGGERVQGVTQRELALADVPWDRVQAWVDDATRSLPGARVEAFRRLPDVLVAPYLDLLAGIQEDVPRPSGTAVPTMSAARRREEEARMEALGWDWLTLVTLEADGTPSAMVDVLYDEAIPGTVRQQLTGVHPSFRGQGRAKWVKAALLYAIRTEFPQAERLTTSNADDNAAMTALNGQLGFRDTVRHSLYRFDPTRLQGMLRGKSA